MSLSVACFDTDLRPATQALLHLFDELLRDGDLPGPALCADREDPDRAVARARLLLAEAAAGFVAADHAAHQGAGQGGGWIGYLLGEAMAGSQELALFVFHLTI